VWPPDKWERLTTASRLAGSPASVLDVGGRGGEMAALLAGAHVRSVNVEPPADIVVAPGRLPFADDEVAAVTSTDVLEHVPPGDRRPHVAELVRVARDRVVLCFPAGSAEKDEAERRLAAVLDEDYGTRFAFLDEHLDLGLPRTAEVVGWLSAAAPGARVTTWYQDGIAAGDRLLLDAVRARRGGDPRALLRVLRAWVRRPPPALTQEPGPENSRAYLVVDLGAAVTRPVARD
jgi:hypothetical protein